jgi:Rap1-interacting factor 1 N terminal
MTSIDGLVSSPVVSQSPSLPATNSADSALEPSKNVAESLPSPPESSSKSGEPSTRVEPALPQNLATADTPDLSPTSCPNSLDTSSGKLRKKVDFSPWTLSTDCVDPEPSIRSLPPSRECQSTKSILKSTRTSLPLPDAVYDQPEDISKMLDSILLQLGGSDRQIRIDAYATLCSSFKAYTEPPGSSLTPEKIQSLLSFIKTDLNCPKSINGELAQTSTVLQALKLLVVIVWEKRLSSSLTDQYRCFILDHSTSVLEERQLSKALILHYLHLLSTQDFSSKIMNTSRANRLLEALKDLSDEFKGNGVISERLMVYQRVLDQAKNVFKSKPSCWLTQLLSAMTCSVKDTRKKAITIGTRAAITLGSSSSVAIALRDLMSSPVEQKDVLSSVICKRLTRMLKSVEEGRQVPQIWSVVILLLRGLEQKFSEWQYLHDWLRIIQKCFNCSDSEARIEANKAWNKLVYIIDPGESTKPYLMKLLLKPVLVQLERPNNENPSKHTRKSACASYCNLLYYTLRPSASFKYYDSLWEDYVLPSFRESVLSNEHNSDLACRILIAVFWKDKITPYRESRALDAGLIEPEELPLLDCRWIRSRTSSILQVFESLFRCCCWGPEAYPDSTAFVAVAWRNFTRALGDACRKEVIASEETIEAIGNVSRFIRRICQRFPYSAPLSEGDLAGRLQLICKTVLLELGPLLLVEGRPSKESSKPSPSHNSGAGQDERLPIIHMFEAIQALPSKGNDGPYVTLVTNLLQLIRSSRSSISSKISLYRQCTHFAVSNTVLISRNQVVWAHIAELAHQDLTKNSTNIAEDASDTKGVLTNILEILELGVAHQDEVLDEAWPALLDASFSCVHGTLGPIRILIERLVKYLATRTCNAGLICTAIVVRKAADVLHQLATSATIKHTNSKARNKQQAEATSLIRCIARLLSSQMMRVYDSNDYSDAALTPIVDATTSLLRRYENECTIALLKEMGEMLAAWLEDGRRVLTSATPEGSRKLSQARKLCPIVVDILGKLHHDLDLVSHDTLFAAIFKTTHRNTINHMLKTWNATYGTHERLEYGPMLRESLTRLTPFVDIQLPGLDDFGQGGRSSSPSDYLDGLDDDGETLLSVKQPMNPELDQFIQEPTPDRIVSREWPNIASSTEARTPVKANSKARLRHDDSQVQFISIDSSPPSTEALDSELLTARQKEVRERQEKGAALLFPDLRSSPAPKSETSKAKKELPGFALAERESSLFNATPATPTLPALNDMTYETPEQSSPTPRSRQQALRLNEIEVPSSPVSAAGPAENILEVDVAGIFADEDEGRSSPPVDMRALDLSEKLVVVETVVDQGSGVEATKDAFDAVVPEGDQFLNFQVAAQGAFDGLSEVREIPDPIVTEEGVEGETHAVPEQDSPHRPEGAQVVERGHPNDVLELPVQDARVEVIMTDAASQLDGSHEATPSRFETPRSAKPAPEEVAQIHSDDNDFWSASQLSQDLDRAASSVASPPPQDLSGQRIPSPPKRKRSSIFHTDLKKRKTTGGDFRSRQVSEQIERTTQVVYDCIEVDSSPSSQQSVRSRSILSQVTDASQPAKRGRGRPRKKQPPSNMPPPAGPMSSQQESKDNGNHNLIPRVEVCLPPTAEQRGSQSSPSSGQVEHTLPLQCSSSKGSTTTTAKDQTSTHQRVEFEETTDDKENIDPHHEAVSQLEKALSNLKKANIDRDALRSIDDLVFEIRTEAQNAAQRSGEHGT